MSRFHCHRSRTYVALFLNLFLVLFPPCFSRDLTSLNCSESVRTKLFRDFLFWDLFNLVQGYEIQWTNWLGTFCSRVCFRSQRVLNFKSRHVKRTIRFTRKISIHTHFCWTGHFHICKGIVDKWGLCSVSFHLKPGSWICKRCKSNFVCHSKFGAFWMVYNLQDVHKSNPNEVQKI